MSHSRYTSVAIFLHWSMALVITALLISGVIIGDEALQKTFIANDAQLFALFQWHKSFGVIALVLITLRITWRLFNKPPTLIGLSNKEKTLASLGHKAVYALLIIMPISGWLMVSSSKTGIPTIVFNLIKWPHIPLPKGMNQLINVIAHNAHYYVAWLLFFAIVGHIAMALIHAKQGHNFLQKMKPQQLTLTAVLLLALSLIYMSTIANYSNSANNSNRATENAVTENLLQFSGVHADQNFSGVFKTWSVESDFEPSTQQLSSFKLTIETESAFTGDEFYDETLQEQDWFNPSEFPVITFVGNTFENDTNEGFKVTGDLVVKGVTYPLTAHLTQQGNALTSKLNLSRLSLGIGVDADPDAEWVDDNINVKATWLSQ